jgi:hypothetical protein
MILRFLKISNKEETEMGLSKKLEEMFSAIAFAEAGELDTAQAMMKVVESEKKPKSDAKNETIMPYDARLKADSAA